MEVFWVRIILKLTGNAPMREWGSPASLRDLTAFPMFWKKLCQNPVVGLYLLDYP